MASYHRSNYLGAIAMSKGSKPRPFSVPWETFDESFDRIFGKDKDAREQRKDVNGVPHCGDDVGAKTTGGNVQTPRKPGT